MAVYFGLNVLDADEAARTWHENIAQLSDLYRLLRRQNWERERAHVFHFNIGNGNHGSRRHRHEPHEPEFCQRTRVLS